MAMSDERRVAEHYHHGDLLHAIETAFRQSGKALSDMRIEDLADIDEFHIGGRQATDQVLGQRMLSEQDHLLDIGCGLGGACRYMADRYRCRVTGIDLTQTYIDTGNILCSWVNLAQQVELVAGSALAMPFEAARFSGAYMLHVGMNIEDKAQLCAEVHRVLTPGARFTLYDVMQEKPGALLYPVPWATDASTSFVSSREDYIKHLEHAGFEISFVKNHAHFAMDYFQSEKKRVKAMGGRGLLGLHTLMQEEYPVKVRNMMQGLQHGFIAPVEINAIKVK